MFDGKLKDLWVIFVIDLWFSFLFSDNNLNDNNLKLNRVVNFIIDVKNWIKKGFEKIFSCDIFGLGE